MMQILCHDTLPEFEEPIDALLDGLAMFELCHLADLCREQSHPRPSQAVIATVAPL
jgi:hypothetical protein